MTSEGAMGSDQQRDGAREQELSEAQQRAEELTEQTPRTITEDSARAAALAGLAATLAAGEEGARNEQATTTEDVQRIGSERVKLTVLLPEREMATLRRVAAKRDISLTDAVRRAIAMEQFIEETEAQGGKLLVELPDHTIRQLVVR